MHDQLSGETTFVGSMKYTARRLAPESSKRNRRDALLSGWPPLSMENERVQRCALNSHFNTAGYDCDCDSINVPCKSRINEDEKDNSHSGNNLEFGKSSVFLLVQGMIRDKSQGADVMLAVLM